jgi:lipid II:glycine glycyltransferase (peptidoglycan interpeptide bridge formation enzyme)
MKLGPAGSYEKTDQTRLEQGTAVAWISREAEDSCWDKFLQETPLGQFQQSAIWARAKATEGWGMLRVVVTLDEQIVGGFQILWRPTWRGRMAYVSKGPVVLPGYPGLTEYAIELLRKLAAKERFRALVVQPPDLCEQTSSLLSLSGFDLDFLTGVNDATWVIDLEKGAKAVEQGMSKTTRRDIREAGSLGIRIREGGRDDINIFFALMLSTCRRQRTAPNPTEKRTIFALWDAAPSTHCIRITLAEYQGKPLAGLACILFGQTASIWKKGWNASDRELRPNELLMHEMLMWASLKSYRFADFCAFDKEMALTMLRGDALSPEQRRTRHISHIKLGGYPRLLPKAQIYFPNAIFRLAYRARFHNLTLQANRRESKLNDQPNSQQNF